MVGSRRVQGAGSATPPGGLSVTVNARGLLAHQDTAYEEWGFSEAMTVTPSADGRGLSMRRRPTSLKCGTGLTGGRAWRAGRPTSGWSLAADRAAQLRATLRW